VDIDSFNILYKTYTRPHMEYFVQAWTPYLHKGNLCLKQVQRRAMKMVKGLKRMEYKEMLKQLGLLKLEERRLSGNLIEAYKMLSSEQVVCTGGESVFTKCV
jgi:ribonuclease P/MRP protein subunit RPP40